MFTYPSGLNVAVLVPCYNEEITVGQVVKDFQKHIPQAKVYVYDNNSKDKTSEIARANGAIVRNETLQGKGNVVRRMFADIDADIYVLVDGDATYDAASAPVLIKAMLENSLDMVNGMRETQASSAYRLGHTFGNRLLTGIVQMIFGKRFNDMLSGYKLFSKRFVKSFPISSSGFEIETELTVHALELNMPIMEIKTRYYARPEGSTSKLSTYRDGWRILKMIFNLLKKERPLLFFGLFSIFFALLSIIKAIPVFIVFYHTKMVPQIPSTVLSAGLMILAFLSLACGLILDTVTHGRREAKQMQYLNYRPFFQE